MASVNSYINIDDFDADASASGQQIAEIIGKPRENIENRAS